MARRAQFAAPGNSNNGDAPPPSTIAAQIVQNQARQTTIQPQDQVANFRGLLHEILHNQASTHETDVGVNAQLVNVVNQAGLVPLTLDNPFAEWDVLLPQAVDSVAVIEATIRRQPEVLLAQLTPDGPQLVLGLLATAISLCGRPKTEGIAVARLLTSMLDALNSSIDLWQSAQALRTVIQECVDESLSALEGAIKPQASITATLPPARSMSRFWPQSASSIAMPQGSTTTITDSARAFVAALELSETSESGCFWHFDTSVRLQHVGWNFRPILIKAQLWDRSFERLARLPQRWIILSYLLQDLPKGRISTTDQQLIAKSLLDILKNTADAVGDTAMPALLSLTMKEVWNELNEDLKIAIAIWHSRFVPGDQIPEHIASLCNAIRGGDAMTDSELHTPFQELSISSTCTGRNPRQRKRRRVLADEDNQSSSPALIIERRLCTLLSDSDSERIEILPDIALSRYIRLTEDEKSSAWQSLADLAKHNLPVAMRTVSKLLDGSELHGTKRPRILSVLAVRACVQRTDQADLVALGTSQFGKHVLSSLHSSLRELRIAAAQTLASFLRDTLPEDVRSQNRQIALEYLRNLSDRNVTNEQETLINAWGQVAISCGDKELNLVLLQLVDYLGHGNPFVCALAFDEIEAIAATKTQTLKELFQPFWRSIAVSVVQDLHSKPQKAQQLCDLLGMDVNTFLNMTQRETLPVLVLTKKKDIIARIALARRHGSTVEDVCMQPRTNLSAILALLLSQSSTDAEDLAMACLTEVAPEFRNTDMSSLVKMDPVLIACEMLKLCGEEHDSRKSRAYQAFQTFASIAESSPGQRKANPKSSKVASEFLEGKMLGILTHMSAVLEAPPGAEPVSEKKRCLKAIAEMFTLAKGRMSFALPQIRSCLHSGLDQPEACETAFGAWLSLIPVLDEEDVPDIVNETFVLIVRHWSAISSQLQTKTHEMLSQLVKSHNTVLQENIMTLPSLAGIPLLSKYAAEFDRLKSQESVESHCKAFTRRLRDNGDTVVHQATLELVPFLEANQEFIHDTAAGEHTSPVLADLLCAILDVTVKHASVNTNAALLCGKALGIVGCLDPNRVEALRKKRKLLALSNFDKAGEVIDWVISLLEDVLVKSFRSVTNARNQGFLAYTIQELLGFCNFNETSALRPRNSQAPGALTRWHEMPESVRTTLTPLLGSRYMVTSNVPPAPPQRAYPGFKVDTTHMSWLRSITYDFMFKGKGDNAKAIFSLLARTIRGQDLAISRFVFPYAALNIIIGGTVTEMNEIRDEFTTVLQSTPINSLQQETIRLCSESVFSALDYMSTWLREKRKELSETRAAAYKTGHSPNEFDEAKDAAQIDTVERFLASIPAEIISYQAMDCRSYTRALYHWEQHIRQERSLIPSGRLSEKAEKMYDHLQDIYSEIDEPDGLEGIAAHLPLISEEQQAINHAKAGRWTAAQAWYELKLSEKPGHVSYQEGLLGCLRETGQYAPLLRYANSFFDVEQIGEKIVPTAIEAHLPLVAEACWMTEDIDALERRLLLQPKKLNSDFNLGVGQCILHCAGIADGSPLDDVNALRKHITEGLSVSGTESLQTCHNELLKLHVLYEIEASMTKDPAQASRVTRSFDKRLNAVGAYVQDKQYILGIRRAIMKIQPNMYSERKVGDSWLTTARLARQAKNTASAYNAVLKAFECGDRGAKVEEARLLWYEGHQRQAIQSLEAAIESGIFNEEDHGSQSVRTDITVTASNHGEINGYRQNPLEGKALLLLAKWLDASGQSQTKDMIDRFQLAARRHQRWEKGHYYLGKHYTKLLDAQKALPPEKQSQSYLTGELTKLVIDNSLRSIPFGNKYWHETIPRVLTLWLQLGMDANKKPTKEDQATFDKRVKSLQGVNRQLTKYFDRVPSYVFYHALPQLISRMTHPHPEVWSQLCNILTRIAAAHPSQTLWSLLAVVKSSDKLRVTRGTEILNRLKDPKSKPKNDASGIDLRTTISQGQRLCDGLLLACEQPIEPRAVNVGLSKDLSFNHKLAPSNLVVPVEATLTASAPSTANSETIRKHKAFTQDRITIQAFLEDVLVLNSLQRPRKITVRGSDGKLYGLLCKPKDDLRKDQRLMEFNGIINRALKRNTESSKRMLYIKTYAVTPLSEESGAIEWVEGIKPIRDILLGIYNRKGIRPNYNEIKKTLDMASSAPEHVHLFPEQVLSQFAPSLHEWFAETYPDPEVWFNARLRYARSAAVMSMVGHILGLGDRHGENILLEEGTGGVFHVDFNCLFDKGLTFEKPELVPFRLTHNMVDAMGPYGHEGPFRKSSELTLGLLRQERDTLMTVLETFLYDPTTDFVGKKKKSAVGVPETPAEILESVATKLKGLLRGETVPLSTEGYVDALIQEATSHFRLASMYIGWCSFL